MFNGNTVCKDVVEINAVNSRGLRALDVLLRYQNEAGDWEIEEILIGAGAMRALDMQNSTPVTTLINMRPVLCPTQVIDQHQNRLNLQ